MIAAQFEDRAARDAFRTGVLVTGQYLAAVDQEDVCRIRLGDEAAQVEHQGIISPGGVGLNLGEDRLEQVAVMDLRVKTVGRKAANAAGDQRDTRPVVHRWLELRQDDECRSGRVQARGPCRM